MARARSGHVYLLDHSRKDLRPKKQGPQINIKGIACGTCGAEVGKPCLTANGKETTHEERRRMATRRANEARGGTT